MIVIVCWWSGNWILLYIFIAADPASRSGPGGGRGRKELRPHWILGSPDALQRLPQPGLLQPVAGTHTHTHTALLTEITSKWYCAIVPSEYFHWLPWEHSEWAWQLLILCSVSVSFLLPCVCCLSAISTFFLSLSEISKKSPCLPVFFLKLPPFWMRLGSWTLNE